MRGNFKGALDPLEIDRHLKTFQVGLTETHMLWLDFFLDKSVPTDVQAAICRGLSEWKHNVARQCDKRFIYFLASRPKLRFSTRRQPRYSYWRDRFVFWVEVGGAARLRKVEIPAPFRAEGSRERVRVPASTTEKLITFHFSGHHSVSFPIHDFMLRFNASTGMDSTVHYIGCTKNPDSRVLNLQHHGFTRMLHEVSSGERDFLLFQHLFKPVVVAKYPKHGLNVVAANSELDLADIGSEGRLIEKALIAYFEPSTQLASVRSARSEVRNLMAGHCIEAMTLGIEYDRPTEYYRYAGTAALAHDRVGGVYKIENGELSLVRDPDLDVSSVTLEPA